MHTILANYCLMIASDAHRLSVMSFCACFHLITALELLYHHDVMRPVPTVELS